MLLKNFQQNNNIIPYKPENGLWVTPNATTSHGPCGSLLDKTSTSIFLHVETYQNGKEA